MTGTDVKPGTHTVTYYVAGEDLSPEDRTAVGFDSDVDERFKSHERVRRIVFRLLPHLPQIYGVLHWSDGTDLKFLDEVVLAGAATESDFQGALLAEPRTVVCLECDSHVRVLAVDPGQPLFASTLARRLRAHVLKKSCPRCGAGWTLEVVEYVD